jgi:crotonobetainyl-CoA:carnitine CoA-transferase CaiB-like acyl-CoA transferase
MPADLLSGIRVAEFGGFVAGPMAGLILADLGAEVIKVEKPAGDDARSVPPFIGGNGFYFVECNRNKKSVVIDLGTADGLAACRRLLAHVDVILDNFRPGVLARLGLDYESLRADNPGIISCSITGYGDDGPFADWAGYDPVLQAMSGMMMSTGMEGLPPIRVAQSTLDKTGALLGVAALQAALIRRSVTGEGGRVSTSLLASSVFMMGADVLRYKTTGEVPKRTGAAGEAVPSDAYETADDRWVFVAVGSPRSYERLCAVMDRPDMAVDPRFVTMALRRAHHAEFTGEMQAVFRTRTCDDWCERLRAAGIACGPVNDVAQFSDIPAIQERFLFEVPGGGVQVPQVRSPIEVECARRTAPETGIPALGEHTEQVLTDLAGLTASEIAALREQKVIQ